MANTTDNLTFFGLKHDADEAVVTILSNKVSDIERADVHFVDVGGKKKCVRCNGDGCPICAHGVAKESRIFIHLFNHNTGEEGVWSRTDKILPQLDEVEQSWGDLVGVPLKIARQGDNFPKYTVTVMPPQKYPAVDKALVEKKVAYRCFMTRSNDELNEFFATGVMPKHEKKEFLSKEEYAKKKAEERANAPAIATATTPATAPAVVPTSTTPHAYEPVDIDETDLPF